MQVAKNQGEKSDIAREYTAVYSVHLEGNMELLEFAKRLRKQSAQRGLTPASGFGAKTLAGIGLFLLAAVLPLRADIIVSVTGTSIGGGSSLGGPFSQVLASSWSSVNAYSDVTVSAELGTFDPTTTGTAFLMDRIGPGATTANQIAAASYTVNSPISTLVPLFTGLGLLPGSYFLVLTGPTGSNAFWRQTFTSADTTIVTAPGVALTDFGFAHTAGAGMVNFQYPPASVFALTPSLDVRFTVTGTLVPEPSSWLLVSSVLAFVAFHFRRRGVGGPRNWWLRSKPMGHWGKWESVPVAREVG